MNTKDKFWKEVYVTEDGYHIEEPSRQAPNKNVGIYRLVKVVKGKTIISEMQKMGDDMLRRALGNKP
jgi:hypothetical protein